MKVKVDKDSNIFSSLGFGDVDAIDLKRKADLMMEVSAFIAKAGLTQAKAAQALGISQPRVSDLVNGKLSLFSLDELVRLCERTGSEVTLVIKQHKSLRQAVLEAIERTSHNLKALVKVTEVKVTERVARTVDKSVASAKRAETGQFLLNPPRRAYKKSARRAG